MFESFKQTLIFSLQPDDVEISNLFIVKNIKRHHLQAKVFFLHIQDKMNFK